MTKNRKSKVNSPYSFLFIIGCSSRLDHHIMYCSTKKHDGRKVHDKVGKSSQYSMECCKTHSFCNNATEWPELPPIPSIGKKEGMLFPSLKKENRTFSIGSSFQKNKTNLYYRVKL